MPEQPAGFDPRQAERLDQAIDRIIAGGTPSATGDAQFDRLVALAVRLHRDLPRDLPDPVFLAWLRDDLTGRLQLVPPAQRRRASLARHLPVYGSLAAVFLVALVAGTIAFWPRDDEPPTTTSNATLMQATTAATIYAFSPPTGTISGEAVTRTAESATSVMTALLLPTSTIAPAGKTASSPTATPPPVATSTAQPTQPPVEGSATVLQATLPGIDPATIEQGPGLEADSRGSGPSADVTYVMSATATSLDATATVYHLSPPAEDPVDFCRDLAAKAGIPNADVRSTDESGRTEVFAGEASAGLLYWRPDAGFFQLSSAVAPGDKELEPDAIADRALAWLDSIGYPVADLGEPNVDDLGDLWLVEIPFASLPAPSVGHPLGVTLTLGRDGTLIEARGYWLAVDGEEPVPLVSAAEAWQTVTHGGGYWRDGGISSSGGEFRAESVRLSSVLTDAGDDLVLQPVIEFSGAFTANDGSSALISVFVQAAGR